MASTPAPLPSLGLLDGLGTAATGNTDSPAPLPSLALLGGLGTAVSVAEEPPLAWTAERIPGAWYVDPGFSAAYAWHQHGIAVANRDEVAEAVGNQGGDPAPLPHLGLVLAPGASPPAEDQPPAAWFDSRLPDPRLARRWHAATYPWHEAGIIVANRDDVIPPVAPEVFSAPPLAHRLSTSTRHARTSATRSARTNSSTR